jgi:hypothetical protein
MQNKVDIMVKGKWPFDPTTTLKNFFLTTPPPEICFSTVQVPNPTVQDSTTLQSIPFEISKGSIRLSP